ncbi:hypothetical protein FE257_003568 [Aspergillus nanangensis]|uniref:Tat pathway signal sequence n=1 Tax=Aspergillus nanangensis TaxID=2582783 RepID=A0AAD4CCQ6_ASPNN|nr:hypothetical protein FE257_003568 [Aspergillus nanangensis]
MSLSRSPEDHDIEEKLLADDESQWLHQSKPRQTFPSWAKALLFLATAAISLLAGLAIGVHKQDLDGACIDRVAKHSPLLSDVQIKYHDQQYNGSFLHETIYRQDASPEVDEAWNALGANYRAVTVPPEEAQRSGLTADHVQINEKYGGGYPANVEGMHHLHCLNLLRQALYYNHDYYQDLGEGAFKNDDYILRRHVSHCLDILRQQLMCTVDFAVFGQVWVHPDHPEPFVDFNTEHRCRNFEDVRQWAEKNQLPEKTPADFLQHPRSVDVVHAEIP